MLFGQQRAELSLYPHQDEFLKAIRQQFLRGHRSVLAVAPTGFGKSETAAMMHKLSADKMHSLFVVHRRGLVQQFSERLHRYGIEHGILMAGHEYQLGYKIQVGSIDTLDRRYLNGEGDGGRLPDFEFIVVDEAHTHFTRFLRLRELFPKAFWLGLTATPALNSKKALGQLYDVIVESTSIRWLTDNGFLVSARYFGKPLYDYEGVGVSNNGEYREDEAEARVNTETLVGDVIANYQKLGEGRPFVVFANSVAHSRHLEQRFNAAGIRCKHIDANTPMRERRLAYEDIEKGALQGLSNYAVLDRGFDCPPISVCILARSLRNMTNYRQMVGRVLRTHPTKTDCIVIDHGGNVLQHGFIDEPVKWTLDGKDINEIHRKQRQEEPKEFACPECLTVFRGPRCPVCAWTPPVRRPAPKPAPTVEAELQEVTREEARKVDMPTKRDWYAQALGFCVEKGKNPGYAAHLYRSKFGVWPRFAGGKPEPIPCGPQVRSYIKSRQVAYHKAREKGQEALL